MARKWISYEMQSVFVGGQDGFNAFYNQQGYVSRLDFIQDYAFSFDVDRQALKQISREVLASKQTQLAPDVNLKLSYYLNDGWNETYLGFNVLSGQAHQAMIADSILNPAFNRNFYITIAPDNYKDSISQTDLSNYNVLGIGNSYINSYTLRAAVGEMASVSCDFVAANASIANYSTNVYMPSVDVFNSGQNAWDALRAYNLSVYDNNRVGRYMAGYKQEFTGGCPFGNTSFIVTDAYGGDSITFGELFSNLQSFELNVNFERKALYGFGNNYPFNRKILRPIMATVSMENLVSDFAVENLAQVFEREDVNISGCNFELIFKNNSNLPRFGLKILNAKLDSYQLGSQIGGQTRVSTNWSFEITSSLYGSNLLVSGSRPNRNIGAYATESINFNNP